MNPQCFVAKLFNILRSKIVDSDRNIAALLKMEFCYYFQLKRPLSTGNVINSAFVWWKTSPLEELQLARAPQLPPYCLVQVYWFTKYKATGESFSQPNCKAQGQEAPKAPQHYFQPTCKTNTASAFQSSPTASLYADGSKLAANRHEIWALLSETFIPSGRRCTCNNRNCSCTVSSAIGGEWKRSLSLGSIQPRAIKSGRL